YLFVTHDLDVAKHISQYTAVMYLGRAVEYSPTTEIFAEPLHPYTQALVKAAPRVTTQRKTIKPALTGDIPNAIERPQGCHFHPRCPFVMPVCSQVEPQLIDVPGGRAVACHLHDPEMKSGTPACQAATSIYWCRTALLGSVQKPGQHRQEQIGAPGHLHVRRAGQYCKLRAGDQLLHQGAMLDSCEVAVAKDYKSRRGDSCQLL